MMNSKKPKITMKAKPKKQKLLRTVNTSDQNSDDEEIDVSTPVLLLLLYH